MDKPNHLDISQPDWQTLQDILQQHLAKHEVWAFGSRVKGNAKPYSDLDIAIKGEHPLGIAKIAELSEALRNSPLPFKVDIVDWATLSAEFKGVIESNQVRIFSS